jgi:hypothetical protein
MITTFPDNIPAASHGFGLESDHYVSGRISAAVAKHGGLGAIRFYGRKLYVSGLAPNRMPKKPTISRSL